MGGFFVCSTKKSGVCVVLWSTVVRVSRFLSFCFLYLFFVLAVLFNVFDCIPSVDSVYLFLFSEPKPGLVWLEGELNIVMASYVIFFPELPFSCLICSCVFESISVLFSYLMFSFDCKCVNVSLFIVFSFILNKM